MVALRHLVEASVASSAMGEVAAEEEGGLLAFDTRKRRGEERERRWWLFGCRRGRW